MLARSFLTPKELNISGKQFDALVQVLGMLERGELPWHKIDSQTPGFNMSVWPEFGSHCGTVGCIGYWAGRLINEDLEQSMNIGLDNLFYPPGEAYNYDWDKIGPEQAAQALRNYLCTGKADWAGILA